MIVYPAEDVPQGTQRWLDLRCGRPTASLFSEIMTPACRPSKSADGYMHHLLAERILGRPIDGFKSQWMARGNEMEARAVAAYEFEHGVETEQIGFVTTDDGLIGCSPDRFIVGNSVGLVEAKAPAPATHVSYLLAATGAGKEYRVQLQGQLWVCEREWVDIISYCPEMPDAVFRVERDDDFIKELSAHVRSFARQLDELTEDFKQRGWIKAPEPEQQGAGWITEEDLQWAMNRTDI